MTLDRYLEELLAACRVAKDMGMSRNRAAKTALENAAGLKAQPEFLALDADQKAQAQHAFDAAYKWVHGVDA